MHKAARKNFLFIELLKNSLLIASTVDARETAAAFNCGDGKEEVTGSDSQDSGMETIWRPQWGRRVF